jgi:protein TonB
MMPVEMQAPRQIPRTIANPTGPEPGDLHDVATIDPNGAGGDSDVFRSQPAPTVVHPDIKAPMRVSSSVEAGLLIRRVIPPYPELAKVMRVEGTVELAATISKTGTIANLRVVSGPPALQQAAFDAVSNWRYRPYLLNGQPVDVETTVNVVFSLQR